MDSRGSVRTRGAVRFVVTTTHVAARTRVIRLFKSYLSSAAYFLLLGILRASVLIPTAENCSSAPLISKCRDDTTEPKIFDRGGVSPPRVRAVDID